MKKLIALLLTLCMALSLAACGGGTTGGNTDSNKNDGGKQNISTELPDKKLTIATSIQINRTEPLNGVGEAVGGRSAIQMVYEPLLLSDGVGNVIPWLAESYEVNDALTEWIFHIREGVTFSNGEALTADDVVCTFNRMVEHYDTPPENSCLHQLWPVGLWGGVEKIDEYTVKVSLNYTFSDVILSFTDTMIIPDEAYAERGEELILDTTSTGYFGTGPWVLQEQTLGQNAVYKKNTNYWNKNYGSYYEEVEVKFITEQTSAAAALANGDIDMYIPSGGISTDLLPQVNQYTDRYNVFQTPAVGFYYLQFNCAEGHPFADEKVREAFLLAIDYQSIVDNVLGGGTVMNQLCPEGFIGYNDSLDAYEYNVEKAKQLLDESSYDGSEIYFMSSNNIHASEDQLLAISDFAKAAGFNIKIEAIENAMFSERRIAGNYDLLLSDGRFFDSYPTNVFVARVKNDEHNHGLYDEKLMSTIGKAAESSDRETYVQCMNEAVARMREISGPLTGLYYADEYAAIGYGITGVELDPAGTYYFQFIDFNVDDPTSTDYAVDWDALTAGL